jgi:hypothetical protein
VTPFVHRQLDRQATALEITFHLRTEIVMNAFRYITAAVLLSSLAAPSVAGATTITYSTVGSFNGTTFTTSGLTATAENGGTLAIVSGLGLGVLGGLGGSGGSFDAIDGTESVRFSFDSGGATGVAFGSIAGFSSGSQLMDLEAFDVHGVSLGVQSFNLFDSVSTGTRLDVSALFGRWPSPTSRRPRRPCRNRRPWSSARRDSSSPARGKSAPDAQAPPWEARAQPVPNWVGIQM